MRRRDFLRMAFATPALTLGGCKLSLSMEQGLKSECRNFGGLAGNALFEAAWKGLKPERVWDSHVHLFGNGRSGGGIWVEPDYDHPKSLGARMRHTFFKNGGCTGDDDERMDQGAVDRLQHIAGDFPVGAKFMLLAFDFTYDESGRKREDLTTFSVSNAYARRVANELPDRFEWIASVHPYREDAVQEVEAARAAGARALKWLPPTMAIDMRSPKCLPVYDALARMNLPLLVHVGEERAVAGAQRHELANPLHLRAALDRGVRVIGAHCASLGENPDLDKSKDPDKAPSVSNFELFTRLMGEHGYEGRLFGDLAAVTGMNRLAALPGLMSMAQAWDGRLLNGSDYPLPGILPLYSMNALVAAGLLDEHVVPGLRDLREGNALAFDFVLKRNLRLRGMRLPDSAFETRGFFSNV